ncbi:dimethyl sulfoxide reductase subunit, partial [Salmonella enterica subsp. enterica serovar Tallahassee str. 0012]
ETTLPASAPRNAHYKAYILGQGDDGIAKNAAMGRADYQYSGGKNHSTGAGNRLGETGLHLPGLGTATPL